MTATERIQMQIGSLMMENAVLAERLEKLQAELEALKQAKEEDDATIR